MYKRQLFAEGALHTRFVDSGLKDIAQALGERKAAETPATPADSTVAGARIDADDPLAVLSHSQSGTAEQVTAPIDDVPPGTIAIRAPLQGTVIEWLVGEGDEVFQGQQVAIMDAMKMEHVILAPESGVIQSLNAELNTCLLYTSPSPRD